MGITFIKLIWFFFSQNWSDDLLLLSLISLPYIRVPAWILSEISCTQEIAWHTENEGTNKVKAIFLNFFSAGGIKMSAATLYNKIYTVNLNSSNTDGSSTMADLNSFLSPYKFFWNLQKTNIEGNFLTLSWNCKLCVLIRIASSSRF